MNAVRRLLAVGLGASVFVLACQCAYAAGPATVTVRVEGLTETLIAARQVTTTTEPVSENGAMPAEACPGDSALGALALASGGIWSGKWYGGEIDGGKFEGLGYEIGAIYAESHAFGSGYFWDLWIAHSESLKGACEAEPEAGQEVLFFPCPETAECPRPLGIEAPASANVGEAVTVKVVKYKEGKASAVAGATVTAAGAVATTEAAGAASVTFASTGQQTVRVSAPEALRDEVNVCVHKGDDGTCGTTRSAECPSTAPSSACGGCTPCSACEQCVRSEHPEHVLYKGPYALVADVKSIVNGHSYAAADAPREISGTILAHDAVTSVGLELRRSYRGRCYTYDGSRDRFVHARCGSGSSFTVSKDASFSYLLPSKLPPGRYVLDVHAKDTAGNVTALARGSSRIVFRVR